MTLVPFRGFAKTQFGWGSCNQVELWFFVFHHEKMGPAGHLSSLGDSRKPNLVGNPAIKLNCIFLYFIMRRWARQDSNLRPSGYEPRALPLSYGP